MEYPEHFLRLINYYQSLPTIGRKTAERLAFHTLSMNEDQLSDFVSVLASIQDKIQSCEKCYNMSQELYCPICKDVNRNQKLICVVESVQDLIALENSMQFDGLYFVLNGTVDLSKPEGIDKLNIQRLKQRVIQEQIDEVIIATNPTLHGETTSLYIAKILSGVQGLSVTRLAHGLPIGANVEYADQLTLAKAIEGRRKL